MTNRAPEIITRVTYLLPANPNTLRNLIKDWAAEDLDWLGKYGNLLGVTATEVLRARPMKPGDGSGTPSQD